MECNKDVCMYVCMMNKNVNEASGPIKGRESLNQFIIRFSRTLLYGVRYLELKF
jgi:hypothetical protein